MRILAVAALPFPSLQGTQVLIGELAESMAARGHEVHLLCYGWGAEERAHGFTVHRIRSVGRRRSLRSGPSWDKVVLDGLLAWEARRLVDTLAPDVVLAHGHEALAAVTLPPGMTPRPPRRTHPVVYHAHTLMAPELPTYFAGAFTRAAAGAVGRIADAALPRRADAIVAVSADLAVSLGGVHLPPALRLPPVPLARREGDHLLYVGNLDRYQGIDALLDALVVLPERVTLTVATASAPGAVAAAAARRGLGPRVRFVPHGPLSSVRALLARAAVVVVPRALAAGFPVKLLEAMAAAAPLVVSARGAHGLTDGVQARIADDDAMAGAIRDLLAAPAQARALGLRGRAHVEAVHDASRSAARLEEILDGLTGRAAPSVSRPLHHDVVVAERPHERLHGAGGVAAGAGQ